MMANPFDQFDPAPAAVKSGANPFDQFDHKPSTGPQLTASQYGADVGKSLGVGVARGAIGMAGLPGDLGNLISGAVSKAGEYAGIDRGAVDQFKNAGAAVARFVPGASAFTGPDSTYLQNRTEERTGKFYQPQTMAGEYAQTVGEFLPGAMMGGAGTVRQAAGSALRYGVIPAVAGETAGQLSKGSDAEPYLKAGTALVAGGLAAALRRPASAEAVLASNLPDYINDGHVTQAGALMRDAGQRGINLSWDEALSQVTGRPVLQDVRRILESAPRTRQQMQDFTADRPQAVQTAVRAEIGQFSPQVQNPSTIGPAVGTAAEGTVNDVRQAINRASEPDYAAAANVLLAPPQMAQVRAIPGYERAAREVRADEQLNRSVAHLPENSVGFLNEVKKLLDQAAENARAPVAQNRNMQRAAGLGQDAEAVRNAGTRASPDYAHALIGQQENRQQYLEPLLQGPLGRLAERDISTKQAIDTLFPKNPIPGSEDEIGTAVRAVVRNNPQAASQLVRAHAEMIFNEASRSLGAEGGQFTGSRFALQIAGNPQQRANLREAVRGLPNGTNRWNGFNRFLDIMEATGQRQQIGSKTSFNTQELERLSQSNGVVGAARTLASPEGWFSAFKSQFEQWKLGRNLDGLANILTDQGSGALLQRLANTPTNSQAATAVAARLLVQYGNSGNDTPLRITVRPSDANQ